ncbi:MAG TPA: hypothetical protein ENI27_08785, partial [bacterium]|nr:hypothetical protein [bacterium]
MKKTVCFLLFLGLAIGDMQSEEVWEGNAAVIRRGEFDTSGLYAASNSFPKNTKIKVENFETGEQVEVTIIKRIDGPGNVFLLLSEQAAAAINLSSSEVIRVK